ncbi:MAG TPA: alkane 1-monooxygenase, partial [Alcanivorax sp.]|nr:alkane 1-monooxygenase [Alcanivorax sp.]
MFAKMHSDTMLKLKKWGYLAFWAAVLPLLPLSAFIGRESGTQDYWAWFLYFVVFGIIPVLDYIIGKDPSNPDEHQQVPSMSQERIYTSALFLMGFIWLGVLFFAGWVFVNNDYSLLGQLGWIVSIGTVGGIIAINLGHEFVHK